MTEDTSPKFGFMGSCFTWDCMHMESSFKSKLFLTNNEIMLVISNLVAVFVL